MKKLFFIFLFVTSFCGLEAQDITGSWEGLIPGTGLHLVFNVKKASDTSYSATFDSPDQKAFGIACNNTYIKQDSIFIRIAIINGGFSGAWDKKDHITGLFKQGAAIIKLDLSRQPGLLKVLVRPQTPKPPFGYYSEDVEYDNADKSLHYGATFTRPNGNGKFPAVIIITGSGTQDRDGTLFGHKLYWVLADYLTKNGIAVLRVDDRGAGKSTTGNKKDVTSLDFSYDVEASLNYLETRGDVDKRRLGLIGHSEGGIIAPMVAARRKDVSFIVMWGAPEVGGAKISAEQNGVALRNAGIDSVAVNAFMQLHFKILKLFPLSQSREVLDQKIQLVFNAWKKEQSQKTLGALYVHDNSIVGKDLFSMYNGIYDIPWWRFMIAYHPEADLSRVKCDVLAVNGEKDRQVNAV